MVKKNFSIGFDSLLGEESPQKNSIKSNIKIEKRATFIVDSGHLDSLKGIGFQENKLIKEILFDALELYINEYKKKNGSIPEKRNKNIKNNM